MAWRHAAWRFESARRPRALYIFEDGKDTLYRVHGSPEWWTIGKSVSSGCVRMINQDVIDLYNRVPDGSPILVTSGLRSV
ncbi:L,D-transpeptidase [Nitratireductor rhodophyticola]|uniref:L,D-transpeptidase n=1 Tax=Nitratireductor rhodophyticola TaxID=2854036 RepID=UPI003BA9FDF7